MERKEVYRKHSANSLNKLNSNYSKKYLSPVGRYFLFVALLVSFSTTKTYSQKVENLQKEIRKIIKYDTEIDLSQNDILLFGLMDESEHLIFRLENQVVDSSATFSLGSVSKVLTYRLTQKILQDFQINPNTPINNYLAIHKNFNQITIEDLMEHRSSLPKFPYGFGKFNSSPDNPYHSISKEDLLACLQESQAQYDYKKQFHYSHFNYALLEMVLEAITKQDFNTSIDRYFPEYPSLGTTENSELIQGFNRSNKLQQPWDFPSFFASEGLTINMKDLLHFLSSEFNKVDWQKKYGKSKEGMKYEAPWYRVYNKKMALYAFTGTASGHSVSIHFAPNLNKGVVVFRNSAEKTRELGYLVLKMITGKKKKMRTLEHGQK